MSLKRVHKEAADGKEWYPGSMMITMDDTKINTLEHPEYPGDLAGAGVQGIGAGCNIRLARLGLNALRLFPPEQERHGFKRMSSLS